MTLIRVGLASKARPGHGSDESWESELDHSGDDLRVCYPITANPIYNIAVLSESDSKGDREVFMVGRANVFANQTEEEIAQAIATEIARSESLTRNAEKAAGKRHTSSWDHNDNLTDSNEDGGDGIASGAPLQVQFSLPSRPKGGGKTLSPRLNSPGGTRSDRLGR
jgi:hypothetical protein